MEFLVLFILLFVSSTQCSDLCSNEGIYNIRIVIVHSVPVIDKGCLNTTSDSYSCHSLQEGLELIAGTHDCVMYTIELETGIHYIIKPVVTDASVHLLSNGESSSVVTCDFDAETVYNQTGGLHTVYFNRSQSVSFTNVIFDDCPLPLRLFAVNNVLVENSTFRYFSEAVFDIHNCIDVNVQNCTFTHNYGTGIINETFRGNTGALAITYNYLGSSASNPNVSVTGSMFVNNTVYPNMTFRTADEVFESGVLTDRGGGMAIFVREDHFIVSVLVSGCNFVKNQVRGYGGAMYILFDGFGAHSALVEDNVFDSNVAVMGGGGVILVGTKGTIDAPHTFNVKECAFMKNQATFGAGLYYSINLDGERTNIIGIQNITFVANGLLDQQNGFGAAIAVDVADNFEEKESFPVNTISDCSFTNNTGENSIVSIGFQIFRMYGKNEFIGNIGSALRVVGTRVIMSGRVEFINNTAVDGAAIFLLSFSQIRLVNNLQLLFHGNKGRYGASIFASAVSLVETFQRLLYNPQCFLVLESNTVLPPSQWSKTGINITFTQNSAWFGAAIYATSLTSCSWVNTSIYRSFDLSFFPNWPVFHIRNDNANTGFPDPYNQRYSVLTDSIHLDLHNLNEVVGWPGKRLNLPLKAVDELGNPTGLVARFSFLSLQQSGEGVVELTPDIVLVSNQPFIANFTYHLRNHTRNTYVGDIIGYIDVSQFGVLLVNREDDSESIPLIAETCIGGYTIGVTKSTHNHRTCQCDRSVSHILLCEDDQDSIIIEKGHWATHVEDDSVGLFFHLCPSGYCRCFFNTSIGISSCANVYVNSDPDRQCVCERKGILCGECRNNLGVSVLLNECVSCDKTNVILIPALVLLDIVVIMIVVFVDAPLPQWSYSLLFYIQVAPLVSLHFPPSFNIIGKYLMYVSSALSLYFPYDFCLYNGISTLESYALRYIPVITALFIVPMTVVLRYCLNKCTPLILSAFNGHGIWTILLLLYTHTLYTATTVLNCPRIPNENGSFTPRWYVDGSVKCFSDGHLPLSLFSLLWILISVIILPVCILLTQTKLQKNIVSKKLGSSLKHPFKKYLGFWYVIEFFRRLFIVVFITAFPDNHTIILLFLMILILLYGYFNPYKGRLNNILELSILILFLFLLLLRANSQLDDILQKAPHNTSVSIPSCGTDIDPVTSFASMLAVFYYIPLFIGLVCVCIWSTYIIWKLILKIQKLRHLRHKIEVKNDGFELTTDYDLMVNHTINKQVSSSELFNPEEDCS